MRVITVLNGRLLNVSWRFGFLGCGYVDKDTDVVENRSDFRVQNSPGAGFLSGHDAAMNEIFLSDLKNDETGVVAEVQGEDRISLRLMEMGLVAGTRVTRIAAAPMGDPLEFEILGFTLSLRSAEARRVQLLTASIADECDP